MTDLSISIDGKRIPGEMKDGYWLVLIESTHQSNMSWVHSCGTLILSEYIVRPIWDNQQPTCMFCHFKPSHPLPDDIILCPDCLAPRTGEVLGLQGTDMPYCPRCETKPTAIVLPLWRIIQK